MRQNLSEVACIRAQLDAEVEAINRVFNGFTVVGKYCSISQRTARIGMYLHQLQTLVGEEEGAKIFMNALEALEEVPCPKE